MRGRLGTPWAFCQCRGRHELQKSPAHFAGFAARVAPSADLFRISQQDDGELELRCLAPRRPGRREQLLAPTVSILSRASPGPQAAAGRATLATGSGYRSRKSRRSHGDWVQTRLGPATTGRIETPRIWAGPEPEGPGKSTRIRPVQVDSPALDRTGPALPLGRICVVEKRLEGCEGPGRRGCLR